MNSAADTEAIDDALLDRMYSSLWPKLQKDIDAIMPQVGAQSSAQISRADTDSILQELFTFSRQQLSILSNPGQLIGSEIRSQLFQLVREIEGAAAILTAKERGLALALCARWTSLMRNVKEFVGKQAETVQKTSLEISLSQFNTYLAEFETLLAQGHVEPNPPTQPREAIRRRL